MIWLAPLRWTRHVAIVLGVTLHLGSVIVHAEVPTIADMTTCNQETQAGLTDRSASPTSKDQVGAEVARQTRHRTTGAPGVAGAVMRSEDPQIHGMDAHRATDAAYRAAYRVCMRTKGF